MSKEIQKVELKEEDRTLLKSVIEAVKKPKELNHQAERSQKPSESTDKHSEPKHEHFAVSLDYMEKGDSCPDCVKGLDAFGKEYLKKTLEERSKEAYECVNCGLGVKENEDKCPNCGGKDARERH